MKKIEKILICVLSAAFVFSAASCGGGETSSSSGGGQPAGGNLQPSSPGAYEGGTHEISVSESNYDFISGGKSDYVVVVPDVRGSLIDTAASELVTFVYQASGVTLETVTDSEYAGGRALSVGDTQAAREAGVSLDARTAARIGDNGVYVQTKEGSVYMMGATDTGTLNAAYTFLEYQLGLEVYGADEIALAENVRDMKLMNMDIVEAPDIQYMQSTYGFTDYNATLRRRMRIPEQMWMTVGGSTWHNSFKYVDPQIYDKETGENAHPEWFSEDGTQLCYTAHGDDESLGELIELVADGVKTAVMEQGKTHITITMEDTNTWCTCNTCAQLRNEYGTDSVSVIRFCNEVSRNVRAWFETEESAPYKCDLQIAFFAYHATEPAPVTYDEATDTYAPIDDTVLCDDNVGILYAPILATYQKDFSDDFNAEYYDTLRGWEAVTDNFYMWTYSTGFHYYLVPTNTYNSMQYNYRLWAEVGTQWLNDQSQYNSIQSTGFCALKLYLNTKLRWNVNYDMDELIGNFFDVYFGPAADTMMTYFNELRAHFLFMEETMDYVGYCYIEPLETRYWPNTLLERWIGYCDEAMEDIAGLQRTDPNAYDMYAENILLESISPRYLLLDLWGSLFSPTELTALRNEFRSDCNALEVNRYAERNAITDLWNNWNL